MSEHRLIAACAFGLEALVRQEIEDLGLEVHKVKDGKVHFFGDDEAIIQTNLWLRTADRVGIELDRFEARSFDELFDAVHAYDWADILPRDAFIHINARSHKSKLYSLRDCQKIVKKAIIKKLQQHYAQETFSEDGPRFPIEIAILNDEASLILDTTGASLHKRGYRTDAGQAPLKETLAAALVKLSRWEWPRMLADPFCGSGTILIEAALIAENRAPGLQRRFQAESWPWIEKKHWQKSRQQARQLIRPIEDMRLLGSDTDGFVLKKARANARQAGVEEKIHFQQAQAEDFRSRKKYGCMISNPPYGQRLSEQKELNALYDALKDSWKALDSWSFFVLSADPEFAKRMDRRASKRRKLFNGKIPCQYYQFFGPFPPRDPAQIAKEAEKYKYTPRK